MSLTAAAVAVRAPDESPLRARRVRNCESRGNNARLYHYKSQQRAERTLERPRHHESCRTYASNQPGEVRPAASSPTENTKNQGIQRLDAILLHRFPELLDMSANA